MKSSKIKKGLSMALCAVVLVGGSIAGTLAYMTSKTSEVKNTFSIGKVEISLDETDVDDSTPDQERDTSNKYNLVPDQTYKKDPTIHFAQDSADSWLFVLVKNDIHDFEPTNTADTINQQIVNNGWKELSGAELPEQYQDDPNVKVYYQEVSANTSDKAIDYKVFDTFTIDPTVTAEQLNTVNNKTVINIIGYAIQKANSITDATAAWNSVKNVN